MSQALEKYRNSGKNLHSVRHEAKGELGEILAKSEVMSKYPPSQGYKLMNDVELNNRAAGEIDWVVVDTSTDNVVATYQVKTNPKKYKADDAQEQIEDIKDAFDEGDIKTIDNAPDSLTVGDFTDDGNFKTIDHYTVGPQDGRGYDVTFDLTGDELEALLDMIRMGEN